MKNRVILLLIIGIQSCIHHTVPSQKVIENEYAKEKWEMEIPKKEPHTKRSKDKE